MPCLWLHTAFCSSWGVSKRAARLLDVLGHSKKIIVDGPQKNAILTFRLVKWFEVWPKLYRKVLTYEINNIRLTIPYIFVGKLVGHINVNIIHYKLGQN